MFVKVIKIPVNVLTSSKISVASGGTAPSLYDSGSSGGANAVALSCRRAISPAIAKSLMNNFRVIPTHVQNTTEIITSLCHHKKSRYKNSAYNMNTKNECMLTKLCA